MENSIRRVTHTACAMHDLYVGTYARTAFVANALMDWFPCPGLIRHGAYKLTDRSAEILRTVSTTVGTRIIQYVNQVLGRPQNETHMRYCRAEMTRLISNAKGEMFNLSKACSIVFDRIIIFSEIPTHAQTQNILEKLYRFKENTTLFTSPGKLKIVNKGVASCFKLNEIHLEIERLKGEDISIEDFRSYTRSIQKNILLTTAVGATIENMGEMIGGFVVDGMIPESYNPAVFLGKKVCELIGKPVGKMTGMALGLTGIYCLLTKTSFMQFNNRRKVIQAAIILLYLGFEYFQLNPLTNYLQDLCGQIGYDFAFYSVALLFNYIGMYMAGTDESLESYVRNMTPSMLVYNGTNVLFSRMNSEGVISEVVAFYLSHIAYNFEMYRSFYNGTLIVDSCDFYTIEKEVTQLQIKSIRQALTGMILQNFSMNTNIHETIRSHVTWIAEEKLEETAQEVIPSMTLLPSLIFLRVLIPHIEEFTNKYNQQIKEYISETFKLIQDSPDLREKDDESLEPLKDFLLEIQESIPVHVISFLIKEFGFFYQFLQSQPLKSIINEYRQALLIVMNDFNIENLDDDRNSCKDLWNLRQKFYHKLFAKFLSEDIGNLFVSMGDPFPFYDDHDTLDVFIREREERYLSSHLGVNSKLIDFIKLLWKLKTELPINPEMLSKAVDGSVMQLEMFYPIIPTQTSQEKTYLVHMMTLLSNAFMIHVLLRMATETVNHEPMMMENRDYLDFLSNATTCFFDLLHPDLSYTQSLKKRGIQYCIQSQLRESC